MNHSQLSAPSTEVVYTEQPPSLAALVGNPNSGKTAIFNLLTGLNQKVSNYPGITVEKKIGWIKGIDREQYQLLDLPGTYSITPESFDERIVAEQVVQWVHGKDTPSVIISVVDASNLSRNLYLTTQLLDLGLPVIVALNMMDRIEGKNLKIDSQSLKEKLGAADVIPLSAKEGWGLKELKTAVKENMGKKINSSEFPLKREKRIIESLLPIESFFSHELGYAPRLAKAQALRLVTRPSALEPYQDHGQSPLSQSQVEALKNLREKSLKRLDTVSIPHRTLEATLRYEWIDHILKGIQFSDEVISESPSRSENADRVLTHRVGGPLIFVAVLYFIFQSIFTWAASPMEWIDSGVSWIAQFILHLMPEGMLRDILVEGVIGGVGAIVIFLPQILILVFFLTLLEDSGYMARVAFMLDQFMTKIGLHGRSVLPLMSGYACAIPGIMATRTIDSWKERLVTILILPLMSCSARLPVYALMIGAFIPAKTVGGIFSLQGLTLVFMYFLGTVTAIILAKVFSRFITLKGSSSFVMELPPYRIPILRSVFRQVYIRGKLFVVNAGKIIMAISIVLWFLASFPKVDTVEGNPIHHSYAGKIGHAVEPLIKPLGFDWKIGIGLITSFAAREVVVSTLATIYNVADGGEDVVNLSEAMKKDLNPESGLPSYSPLMALALMVFYVYAAQCMATFAIVRNETNSWRWPLFMIFYMTGLAYGAALLVYQGGQALGLG